MIREEGLGEDALYSTFFINKRLGAKEKYCSFVQSSYLSRHSRCKFPFFLKNKLGKISKPKRPKKLHKFYELPHNEVVSAVLFTIYYIFYFSWLLDYEDDLLELDDAVRSDFFLFLFNNSTLYYFLNIVLYQLYIYNTDLKDFIYSYTLDLCYSNSYLNLFNYYIFSHSLIFYVLLNLGLIKLEHDKVLTPEDKWDKIPKMDVDFFDYSEFSEFNISNDSLLRYQDDMFSSQCAYEFYLDFTLFFFNIFNLSFFCKLKLKRKVKPLVRPNAYLSKVLYNEAIDCTKEDSDEDFVEDYDEFLLVFQSSNINKLDYYNYIMDIRSFTVKIPYLFFLLYSWYTVYYRNCRYNLYIRGFNFFDEYICKMKVFILRNNPYGKNKTKMPLFYFQRLWTIDHFKLYVEERFFNKWFSFYSTHSFNLKKFITNESLVNLYSFKNLLNDFNLNLFLNINKLKNFEYVYEFYYDNLLDLLDINRSIVGYKLAMSTKSHKYSKYFRFGKCSFLEFDSFIEMMYALPTDINLYYKHFNKVESFDFVYELYNKYFFNFYFLKDLRNFNSKADHDKSYKMVNLYNKLTYLSFYVVDPYFFKYFWRKYFPRRLKRLWKTVAYLEMNLIQSGVRGNTQLNIANYDFFHYYFNWRTDTGTSVQQNNFYKDEFSASLSISNMMVKSNFLKLLNKLKLVLNRNKIFNIQKLQHFVLLLKIYYTVLLNQNIDFVLHVFFSNINKFLNIQNNTNAWLLMGPIIDNNFIYRYYVYIFLFENTYYADWFNNKMKRVLWIFHKKDYREHEGVLFYKKKYNEMF